jgi:hypothetical protein
MPSWLQLRAWEDEKEPQLHDFAMILVFALFFPAARFLLDRILLDVSRLPLSISFLLLRAPFVLELFPVLG